jgi:hypothetical protein
MKKYLKSKTVWFNTLIGVLAVLETQTQIFASFVGPEYLPFVGLFITTVNIYLRSITTESLAAKEKKDDIRY